MQKKCKRKKVPMCSGWSVGRDRTLMALINIGTVEIWETENLRLKCILFQLSMRHFSENARSILPQKSRDGIKFRFASTGSYGLVGLLSVTKTNI